jgi:hypothetical protein
MSIKTNIKLNPKTDYLYELFGMDEIAGNKVADYCTESWEQSNCDQEFIPKLFELFDNEELLFALYNSGRMTGVKKERHEKKKMKKAIIRMLIYTVKSIKRIMEI